MNSYRMREKKFDFIKFIISIYCEVPIQGLGTVFYYFKSIS